MKLLKSRAGIDLSHAELAGGTPAALAGCMQQESTEWGRTVRSAGVRLD